MISLEVWFSYSYAAQTDFTKLLRSTLTQKLMYTTSDLTRDLIVACAHDQIDKWGALLGNDRVLIVRPLSVVQSFH